MLGCSAAFCQTTAVTLAGQGYRIPQTAVDAAPGQVMVLHLYGLAVTSSDHVIGTPEGGEFPLVLSGISVDLVQGNPPKTTRLPLRALYQYQSCTQLSDCVPLTGITLQLPFELETQQNTGIPALRVTQNGKAAGGVSLRPLADNVHVLNTCDDSQIFISAAYSVPQNVCTPVVMVNNQLNSLYNLAHGGDQLAMWAYGLGAKTEQSPQCCNSPEQLAKPVQQVTFTSITGRMHRPRGRCQVWGRPRIPRSLRMLAAGCIS